MGFDNEHQAYIAFTYPSKPKAHFLLSGTHYPHKIVKLTIKSIFIQYCLSFYLPRLILILPCQINQLILPS
jgi:hypothetical protein